MRCCVCGWTNRKDSPPWHAGTPFHRFPTSRRRAEVWVRALNNSKLVVEEAYKYSKDMVVCQRHFETSQYNTPERLRLNRNAVPTLFLASSDSTEDVVTESQIQKVISLERYNTTQKFTQPSEQDEESRGTDVSEETGTQEDTGSQLLTSVDSELHSCEYSNEGELQQQQKAQECGGMSVQEDIKSGEDVLTETDSFEHRSSNGIEIDLQNVCREPETHVGGTAVNERDRTETCDITSDHGDTDECRDVKFIPNEPCTVAVDSWENLPNQLCRLCASTDEHPKQSIVGWLGMLNEIIPDLVALDDGLPQHICRPCTNKLYTCTKIKVDFVEAYNKLQESCGFARSPGIQFTDIPLAMSDYPEEHFLPETEEQLVSETEEQIVPDAEEQLVFEDGIQLVSEVPSEGLCRVTLSSKDDFLEGKQMTLNTGGDLSLNLEEYAISATRGEAVLQGSFPQGESESFVDTSGACDIKERKVGKYKYVCGECEEMFTTKGALNAHRLTHPKVFECECCRKKCRSAAQLDDHKRIHTKELPFMCEVCGKCFRTTMQLHSHKYVHKPRIYACEICNKKCSGRFILRQHKKVHFTDTKLICEVCGKILYTPFSLQIHLRTHTGEKPFQCDVCGKCFISAGKLKHHRVIHADQKFQCITCGKVFNFKQSLVEHEECHSKLQYYRCVICFRAYSNIRNMRSHRRIYCKQPICIVCNETFLTDEMVREHRSKEHTQGEITLAAKIYSRQQRCKCPLCAQGVTGINNMVKHMKECHSGYNYEPFGCEQCSETFSTVSALHIHTRCHSENRLFNCLTCGKGFKAKKTLKWHNLSFHKNQRTV
ncbi:hypothetical protein B7P43_G02525 [Cryptotermes secundus]|uniref:Uncharacterized protein n=2 Tax=Cryptotermes secundus TaxID=105785 RepID=A0A2J7Q2H3_9NEOP|nr:zinc finger protein 502 isoform X2 [Cryptotermes secundus]PNF22788.1 hypothetical protein B7P43_G02525 [Cryptotermes secundus]